MTIDAASLLGRGLSFPPRIGPDGRLARSAGTANVRESIRIILSTERSERVMLPQFGGGLKPFLFKPNTPATHRLIQEEITQAVGRWEPRVEVESVTVAASTDDPRAAIATIRYRLLATGELDRNDITVLLEG